MFRRRNRTNQDSPSMSIDCMWFDTRVDVPEAMAVAGPTCRVEGRAFVPRLDVLCSSVRGCMRLAMLGLRGPFLSPTSGPNEVSTRFSHLSFHSIALPCVTISLLTRSQSLPYSAIADSKATSCLFCINGAMLRSTRFAMCFGSRDCDKSCSCRDANRWWWWWCDGMLSTLVLLLWIAAERQLARSVVGFGVGVVLLDDGAIEACCERRT